jgi:HTH-type transcriptional regulator/antitoxin MqsA
MKMKCPICGAAELVQDTRDVPYTYKGESTLIPAVTGDFCPACAEVILEKEAGQRFGQMVRDRNKTKVGETSGLKMGVRSTF